ncbi:MAG: sigma factor, partial [Bauldia sp.]
MTTNDSDDLLRRLRGGDEVAFASLVRRLHRSMTAVAIGFVRSHATAEEVVQDTWVAVIEGLDGFEARSSLKNWIFSILANKARTRAVRDSRMIPVADFARDGGDEEPTVDPARFDAAGSWIDLPAAWDDLTPERIVAGRQVIVHVGEAIAQLPAAQRSV